MFELKGYLDMHVYSYFIASSLMVSSGDCSLLLKEEISPYVIQYGYAVVCTNTLFYCCLSHIPHVVRANTIRNQSLRSWSIT